MAEFLGQMKPDEYKKLTRRQRSILIVGAFVALFFQSLSCYIFGLMLHQLPH